MTRAFLLGVCLLLQTGCGDEPFIVLPGGELNGEVADPLVDWSELNSVEVIQLETRPDDPYSVNIWMAALGQHIYVATSEGGTNWTEHLDSDRDVRIKINGVLYELEAVAVIDTSERESVAEEYVRKYDVDDDDEDSWVSTGRIYRLDRR